MPLQRIDEGKRSTLSSERRHFVPLDKRGPSKESVEVGATRAFPPKANAAPATSVRKQNDNPLLRKASSGYGDMSGVPTSNIQKPAPRVGAARPRTSNLNSGRG